VTVTKSLTSTTRAVLDNIRQIIIWGFSLIPGIEWQEFNPLTVHMPVWLFCQGVNVCSTRGGLIRVKPCLKKKIAVKTCRDLATVAAVD
jgi:hypothetical protein